jgi:diadenosine tetraphosphate (Ap4A) HIT family hydrolase
MESEMTKTIQRIKEFLRWEYRVDIVIAIGFYLISNT